MKLYPIQCGKFKLDGGAMFGVVPKSLWEKTNPADERNLIELGTRSLLMEDGKKLILIDCGLGNKQDDKFFGHYSLWGDDTLNKNLKKYGFVKEDITDVFLTHLHFDHCGGAIEWNDDKSGYRPAFKNAQFWTNESSRFFNLSNRLRYGFIHFFGNDCTKFFSFLSENICCFRNEFLLFFKRNIFPFCKCIVSFYKLTFY